jgi:hypothetical protein
LPQKRHCDENGDWFGTEINGKDYHIYYYQNGEVTAE